MLNRLLKRGLGAVGLNVTWRDRLAEMIPANYHASPFLPRLYRQTFGRVFYFREMVARVEGVEGDVVECGVSIGHGLLFFMLLADLTDKPRQVYGFDSFEGFPDPAEADRRADGAYTVGRGVYASRADVVHKVLEDGRVSKSQRDRLRLVPAFFEKSLPGYDGRIALLHLDCDLYDSYKICLATLFDKVVPGGVVMFDEYEDPNFPGAKKAIDEFLAERSETLSEYNAYGCRKFFVVKH